MFHLSCGKEIFLSTSFLQTLNVYHIIFINTTVRPKRWIVLKKKLTIFSKIIIFLGPANAYLRAYISSDALIFLVHT